jgi:ABC-type branched-subunit amino acid transport system ATPase component/ABC-type branched-subunit amino acid transport system permease subunit
VSDATKQGRLRGLSVPAVPPSLYRPLGVAVWVVALIAFGLGSEYHLGLATTVGINAILALSLVILTGYAGQFSLASAAFFGIGAYTSGILTVRYGVPALAAMVAGCVIASIVAVVVGRPIFRLRGHFLAVGTLAVTEITYLLFNNLEFTGGASGFGGIEPFSLGSFTFETVQRQYYLVWVILGLATWASLRLGASREGRALRALRSREVAAEGLGVSLTTAKTKVFVLSSIFGSVAGSLYAHQILYINPPPFGVLTSVNVLVIAIIGGLMSPWGAIVGAVAFTLLQQAVERFLPTVLGAGSVGAGETFTVALVLVLVLVFMPRGLVGALGALRARVSPSTTDDEPAAHDATSLEGLIERRATDEGEDVPVLECRGISKSFGGVKAVNEVDLTVAAGEVLAVIGPNGAGKTTLINLISGVLPPSSGELLLDGHDITGWRSTKVARHGVARTFQTPAVFHEMTSEQNVLVGSYLAGHSGVVRSLVPTPGVVHEERHLRRRAHDLLAAVGLEALADRQAEELSLGHAKVLEIARALAMNPRVILLDEPAAGLNRAEKLALAALLRQLGGLGVSMLLVEHDMELVMSVADRVHVLDFGRTLRVGSPSEVRRDPAVIAAYLGTEDGEVDVDVRS